MNQKGQIVIIILLVMVIALAIGLSIAGRSMTEITTSTNTENSTRAFSAAEAGIEKLLSQDLATGGLSGSSTMGNITFSNQSQAKDINWEADLPKTTKALEYPPFGKESFGQFWLADWQSLARFYSKSTIDLYFGTAKDYAANLDDQPAAEIHLITKDGDNFIDSSFFYDSYATRGNGFNLCTLSPTVIETSEGLNRSFYCKQTINFGYTPTATKYPILLRVRLLYTNSSHPVALQPSSDASLPAQAKIFKSTGTAGNVQRTLKVFQQKAIMPQFFDYALFSAGSLIK